MELCKMRRDKLKLKFEPSQWNDYINASCYTYALNIPTNEWLIVGNIAYQRKLETNCEDSLLIKTIQKEALLVGYNDVVISQNELILQNYDTIYMSRCRENGYYHFFRNDSGIIWSHKKAFELPTRIDFYGNVILDPKKSAEGGYDIGYYIYIR